MASLLYRFACRTFQKVFFVAVHFMPWREPQVIHGAGSLRKLPSHLKANGVDNVLLVTDETLSKTEHFQNIQKYLEEAEVKYSIYDQTIPNPTIDIINDATKIYRKNKCNGLVAFGGGSAIDCAKGVGIRIARRWTPISFMRGTLRVLRKIPYLVAIPTTAGTGSEATVAAVISDPRTHEKFAINDFVLIPKLAILDANITLNLPPHLTATTATLATAILTEAQKQPSLQAASSLKTSRQLIAMAIISKHEKTYRKHHTSPVSHSLELTSVTSTVSHTVSGACTTRLTDLQTPSFCHTFLTTMANPVKSVLDFLQKLSAQSPQNSTIMKHQKFSSCKSASSIAPWIFQNI